MVDTTLEELVEVTSRGVTLDEEVVETTSGRTLEIIGNGDDDDTTIGVGVCFTGTTGCGACEVETEIIDSEGVRFTEDTW